MTTQELLDRLANHEDNFVERKSGKESDAEYREAIVAFANSVPEGRTAVLYLGIADNGGIVGVPNPDKKQKVLSTSLNRTAIHP
jgi:alpha-galactosidase/6-phospho-beta-glucosidase family protein